MQTINFLTSEIVSLFIGVKNPNITIWLVTKIRLASDLPLKIQTNTNLVVLGAQE
jgi:hypothetical protein